MGDAFELEAWMLCADAQDCPSDSTTDYVWQQIWRGDDPLLALEELLRNRSRHGSVRLVWRDPGYEF